MAKVIIDVDDNLYTRLFDNGVNNYDDVAADMAKAIRKGTVFPEGVTIKSLEALGKIKKEIDDSISICQEHAKNNDWCDGELAGFLQSKDIINRNLSDIENDD